MRRSLLALALVFISTSALALNFPPLAGRVVDAAHILSLQTVLSLNDELAVYEHESSNQVVVATIDSLEGTSVEDYGYQLGRAWGIGQTGKSNGVVLVVAPHEKQVRIEVGYGLEGILTDAKSEQIIQTVILPDFRKGQIEQGIVEGTEALLATLKADESLSTVSLRRSQIAQHFALSSHDLREVIFAFILLGVLTLIALMETFADYRKPQKSPCFSFLLDFFENFLNLLYLVMRIAGSSRSGSSGSSSEFSGGGGSFGGGGASGQW